MPSPIFNIDFTGIATKSDNTSQVALNLPLLGASSKNLNMEVSGTLLLESGTSIDIPMESGVGKVLLIHSDQEITINLPTNNAITIEKDGVFVLVGAAIDSAPFLGNTSGNRATIQYYLAGTYIYIVE